MAQRAAKRSLIPIGTEQHIRIEKENHETRGVDRGHVCLTTTSGNMFF